MRVSECARFEDDSGSGEEEPVLSAAPVETPIQPVTRLSHNLLMVTSDETLILRRLLRRSVVPSVCQIV